MTEWTQKNCFFLEPPGKSDEQESLAVQVQETDLLDNALSWKSGQP